MNDSHERRIGQIVDSETPELDSVLASQDLPKIRWVTVGRGNDPWEFPLLAFYGTGPFHAAAVAAQMAIGSVSVPESPGVYSARGLLLANVRTTESRSNQVTGSDRDGLEDQFRALDRALEDRITRQGHPPEAISIGRWICAIAVSRMS